MKKILKTVSLATLVAVTSISAASAEAFKGFYVGAEAGWQHNHNKINFSDVKSKNGKDAFLWGANFGMSTVSSNGIYLAGEADINFITGSNTSFQPALFAKVGYRFAPKFVLAAKAGVTYNRYQLKDSFGNTSNKKTRYGFAPGVEGLYAVDENSIVGLSYVYTHHNTIHFGTVKAKPTSHAVSVKYAYKF